MSCVHGATREGQSITRSMRELDALADACERHRVIAHDITAAKYREANCTSAACTGVAMTRDL